MSLTKIPYPRSLRGTMCLVAFTYVRVVCSRLYMYFYFKLRTFSEWYSSHPKPADTLLFLVNGLSHQLVGIS